MDYDYDLFVIGAGSGGVRASRFAAAHGARVAVAEDRYLGGTCVNVGCVPKKLFVYGSHFSEDFEDAKAYGWDAAPGQFHWPTLRDNKSAEIERLNGIYRNLLDGAGVTLHEGTARLVEPHRVAIGDRSWTSRYVLIATGGWPFIPEFPGSELAIDSNDAFYLERFPQRVAVVGGGYIGVEFAGIFHGLGADTHLLYRRSLFLRGFDQGVREHVRDQLREKGIGLHFETDVERITRQADQSLSLELNTGERLEVDTVLYATGRKPNVSGLGLGAVGVDCDASGAVVVDDYYRTSVPHILAIGDVTDRVQLTPVAIAEGMCVADNLFGPGPERTLDYTNIPTAVFCQPNIGTVGFTEDEAAERFAKVKVFESSFRPMKHTMTGRNEKTYMKLLVSGTDDRVVGAHMVGPDAGEIIQGISVAIKAGATKGQFDTTIGIHPTAAEEFVTMREPSRVVGG